MTGALDAQGLGKSVRLRDGSVLQLLDDVSLRVEPGESCAIRGVSGSGKTTLLTILGLLLTPDRGQLSLQGRELTNLSDAERSRVRNRQLGFVFQTFSLIPSHTALRNVTLPLEMRRELDDRSIRTRATEMLDAVGLATRLASRPAELSGGEQQRVAIARALVGSPSVILADEPTGSLDQRTAGLVLDILFENVRRQGAALILVTHDPAVAEQADRTLTLDNGVLADSATVA